MATLTVANLPHVGDASGNDVIASFVNGLRVEAINARDAYTGFIPIANALYLMGTSNGESVHVYNKCQTMVHSFVQQAAQSPPVISIKPITVMDTGPIVVDMSGQPVIANAAFLASYMQTIFDAVWYRRSRADQWFNNVVRDIKVNGWQDTLIEWHRDRKCLAFHRIPTVQWYKDPTQADIEDAAYMGLDFPMDAEEAKRLYPDLSERIDATATNTIMQAPASNAYSQLYIDQQYNRPMTTMCYWWLRNREMPMTDQEAIASGLVVAKAVEIVAPDDDSGGNAFGMPGNTGQDQGPIEGSESPDGAGESGGSLEPPESVEPQVREALFLRATGDEVTMASDNWPTKKVLSQTIQIAGQIVSDIECESSDIPVVTGFNVQFPYRPYGQSALYPVQSLQDDLNTVHGSIVDHTEFYGAPYGVADKRLQEQMPQEMKNQYVEPGKVYFADLEMGQSASDMIHMVDPPAMPPALPQTRSDLVGAFNDASAFSSVRQGETPTANASGELVNTLLAASQANTEYTFISLNSMLQRAAMLSIGYIQKDFDVPDYYQINRNFDMHNTATICALMKDMEWGVDVEDSLNKERKSMEARQDYSTGIIDLETLHDVLGYDHKTIMQRMQNLAASAVGATDSGSKQEPLKAKGSKDSAE